MRLWYIKRQNVSILNAHVLLLFGGTLLVLLAWLMPHEQAFREMLATGEADRVSIAYAKLLLAIDPDDDELRGLLASQYYQVGQYHNAWAVLKDHSMASSLIGVKTLQRVTYAWPPGATRRRWEKRLIHTLERFVAQGDAPYAALSELAAVARSLERPAVAAVLAERAYAHTGATEDLLDAARAWLAADNARLAQRLLERSSAINQAEVVSLRIVVAQALGDVDSAFAAIDAYLAVATPSPTEWVRFANVALAANRPSKLSGYLSQLGDLTRFGLDELTPLSRAAVATGELELAIRLMEQGLALGGNEPELASRMAQVYEWTGDASKALAMWTSLVDQYPDPAAIDRAWRLGRDLYQYGNVALLLGKLSTLRQLNDEEVTALRVSFEQAGQPTRGDKMLKDYVATYPNHRRAWNELIELQFRNDKLDAVESSWRAFARFHKPELVDVQQRAKALWWRFQGVEALSLLQSWSGETSAEYWRQIASYAWFLDERATAQLALERLLGSGEVLSLAQLQQVIESYSETDPDQALKTAMGAIDRYPKRVDFVFQALRLSVRLGNSEVAASLFQRLLARDPVRPDFANNPEFWGLYAQHLQRLADLDGAKVALLRALALTPNDASLRASLVWLVLTQKDNASLASIANEFAIDASDSPPLWPALAAAYNHLGDAERAAHWYLRALPDAPDDIDLMLSFSAVLETLGRIDSAYRLRQHALEGLLDAAIGAGELDSTTLLWASRSMLSPPEQKRLIHQLIPAPNDRQGATSHAHVRFALLDSLRRQHYTAARFWLFNAASPDADAELAIAVDAHDKSVLTRYLSDANAQRRSSAALALGSSSLAQALAPSDPSLWASGHQRGWQTRPRWQNAGGVQQRSIEVHHQGRWRSRRFDSDLLISNVRFDGQQGRPAPDGYREVSAQARLYFDSYVGAGVVTASVVHGPMRSFVGLTAEHAVQLDRRNQLRLTAALNERVPGGGAAGALLRRRGATAGWVMQPARNHRLSAQVNGYRYVGPDGQVLGSSRGLELNHRVSLMRAGLAADLWSSVRLQRSQQRPLGSELEALLGQPGAALVPQSVRQVSLGGVVWKGAPGAMSDQRSGLRYRLESSIGYQWPARALVYDADLAVGVALFGGDELSFSAGYASAVQNNASERGVRAALGYSRFLD